MQMDHRLHLVLVLNSILTITHLFPLTTCLITPKMDKTLMALQSVMELNSKKLNLVKRLFKQPLFFKLFLEKQCQTNHQHYLQL